MEWTWEGRGLPTGGIIRKKCIVGDCWCYQLEWGHFSFGLPCLFSFFLFGLSSYKIGASLKAFTSLDNALKIKQYPWGFMIIELPVKFDKLENSWSWDGKRYCRKMLFLLLQYHSYLCLVSTLQWGFLLWNYHNRVTKKKWKNCILKIINARHKIGDKVAKERIHAFIDGNG